MNFFLLTVGPYGLKFVFHQKVYGARKLMKEFSDKTRKRITPMFLNPLKETGKYAVI